MRKYIFRGKTTTTKQWIFGGYNCANGNHMIIKSGMDPKYGTFTVYEDSVGLHTNQFDIAGGLIFENDIVYVLSEDEYATVIWDENESRFILQFDGWNSDFSHFYGHDCEIVDNTFDRKECDVIDRL